MTTIDFQASDEGTPLDVLVRQEEMGQLQAAFDALSRRDKDVLNSYYVDGLSLRQIGEKINVSHETVRTIIQGAIEALKEATKETV